jgi:hypothetical protein
MDDEAGWWFGFDCAHFLDLCPEPMIRAMMGQRELSPEQLAGMSPEMREMIETMGKIVKRFEQHLGPNSYRLPDPQYRTLEYVKQETTSLALQLFNLKDAPHEPADKTVTDETDIQSSDKNIGTPDE